MASSPRRDEILGTAARLFESSGIRTSLTDIADACGILPGSLYSHFASKEAIVVELVARYQTDLDETAEMAVADPPADPIAAIITLGTAIAECSVRHRAALLLTYYEPPSVFSTELADRARRTPEKIVSAMHVLLDAAMARGLLRPGVDLKVFADRIAKSMLHVGFGVYHRLRGAQQVPAIKCRMLLEGIATAAPSDASLDTSPAHDAADHVIAQWRQLDAAADRLAAITSAARAEFSRRGYSATTIRDVATAAGMRPGNLYRDIESKEHLLEMVLTDYARSVDQGWTAVLDSRSSPLEKIDALCWININAVSTFREEHRIQSASLLYVPPVSKDLGLSFPAQLARLSDLLDEARRAGQVVVPGRTRDLRARCTYSLIWVPDNIVDWLGPAETLRFSRETFLRGATSS